MMILLLAMMTSFKLLARQLQLSSACLWSSLLEQEYGVQMRTQIDQMLIENLLIGEIPEIFEFALFSETPS